MGVTLVNRDDVVIGKLADAFYADCVFIISGVSRPLAVRAVERGVVGVSHAADFIAQRSVGVSVYEAAEDVAVFAFVEGRAVCRRDVADVDCELGLVHRGHAVADRCLRARASGKFVVLGKVAFEREVCAPFVGSGVVRRPAVRESVHRFVIMFIETKGGEFFFHFDGESAVNRIAVICAVRKRIIAVDAVHFVQRDVERCLVDVECRVDVVAEVVRVENDTTVAVLSCASGYLL